MLLAMAVNANKLSFAGTIDSSASKGNAARIVQSVAQSHAPQGPGGQCFAKSTAKSVTVMRRFERPRRAPLAFDVHGLKRKRQAVFASRPQCRRVKVGELVWLVMGAVLVALKLFTKYANHFDSFLSGAYFYGVELLHRYSLCFEPCQSVGI